MAIGLDVLEKQLDSVKKKIADQRAAHETLKAAEVTYKAAQDDTQSQIAVLKELLNKTDD